MNKTKQFWTLVKFQILVNPTVWMLPVFFLIPHLVTYSTFAKFSSLDLLLGTSNMIFAVIFGIYVLSPESVQRKSGGISVSSTEFLLTRAVDRRMISRARVFIYYCFISVVPLGMWIYSYNHPDIQVFAYERNEQELILSHLPGSAAVRDHMQEELHSHLSSTSTARDRENMDTNIMIPNGNILIQEWVLSTYVMLALGMQVIILAVSNLKYRTFFQWGLYFALLISMTGMPFLTILTHASKQISWMESSFLYFSTHQIIWWITAIVLFLLGQVWCERRFTNTEQ